VPDRIGCTLWEPLCFTAHLLVGQVLHLLITQPLHRNHGIGAGPNVAEAAEANKSMYGSCKEWNGIGKRDHNVREDGSYKGRLIRSKPIRV
jgi:hypothetical protein